MQVVLNGKMTKDPEIKFLDSGKSVTNFSIAVNGFRNGEKTVSFYNCQVWDNDFVYTYCKKGQDVCVEGYDKEEKYTNRDGEKKTATKIVVKKVGFGGSFAVVQGIIIDVGKQKINNRDIQVAYLKNSETLLTYRVENFTKNLLENGGLYTVFGRLEMVENDFIITVSQVFI